MMKFEKISIKELIPATYNPRKDLKPSDKEYQKIKNSIQEFGYVEPIIVNKDNTIIGGHQRVKVLKDLGYNEIDVIKIDIDKTKEKALNIALNKITGEWDYTRLSEVLEELKLEDFDLDITGFELDELDDILGIEENEDNEKYTLKERWIIPPFSIIDGRLGEWLERKRGWLQLGIKSELGRDENLMNTPLKPKYSTATTTHIAPSTSVFDPALTELLYKWFCIDGGTILDPFAGGSVRGVVAERLGYKYNGVDLSERQIEANKINANQIIKNNNINWKSGNSLDIKNIMGGVEADLVFSCPPYVDLEVYSNSKDDLSNMEYDEFLETYRQIIVNTTSLLKNNRFAIFVVGEVRNKKGNYYNFVGDTIKAFVDAGLHYYNEIIYITPNGTAGLRADKTFSSGRKTIKTHQNILVFFKGDNKNIKDLYPRIEIEEHLK